MPTLRLEEVLAEHTISPELTVHVDSLQAKGTIFDKLDVDTANHLRALAAAFNISVFDLFDLTENLYRLKILDIAYYRYPLQPTCIDQLKILHDDMKIHNFHISFPLLCVYATQSLPLEILSREDLLTICDFLNTNINEMKQKISPPNQTISVEPSLKYFGITIDDLAILLAIPKEFIHWIDMTEKEFDFSGTKYTISMCSIPPFSWFCR